MQENLKKWLTECVLVHYARLQNPVAPSLQKEPVSEFVLESTHAKYVVEKMWWSPIYGLIWMQKGELDMTPAPNVLLIRSIVSAPPKKKVKLDG